MRTLRIIGLLLLVAVLAYAVAIFGGCSTSGSGVGDRLRTETTRP